MDSETNTENAPVGQQTTETSPESTPAAADNDFNKKLNSAIATHIRQLEKRLEKQFKASPTPAPVQVPETSSSTSSNAEFNALKLQLTELQQQLETANREREQEKNLARQSKKSSGLIAALGENGIVGEHQKIALKLLHDQIDFENDNLVFKTEKDGNLPLRDGLKRFLQSETGKILTPVSVSQKQKLQQQQQIKFDSTSTSTVRATTARALEFLNRKR